MTTKLYPPDKACREMQIGEGRIYRQERGDGGMVVENEQHRRLLKAAGAFEPGVGFAKTGSGFRCGCGFLGFFRKCGSCGSMETVKE